MRKENFTVGRGNMTHSQKVMVAAKAIAEKKLFDRIATHGIHMAQVGKANKAAIFSEWAC